MRTASTAPADAMSVDRRTGDIGDQRAAAVDRVAHVCVKVDTHDDEPGLREGHRERQPDIAQPDDADARGSVCDSVVKRRSVRTVQGRPVPPAHIETQRGVQ
jgi:hypothetical protein